MRRLKVLYLPHPLARMATPWSRDVVKQCGRRHDLTIFARERPWAPQFQGIEVVVDMGGEATVELIEAAAAAGVKYLQAQTTGLDHVHVDKIKDRGIMLAHCPGTLSCVALAESAMMFILLLAHRFRDADRNFRAGTLYQPTGVELEGQTLGIVGFGSSGVELARRSKPFGMRIMAIDVRPIDQELRDEIQPVFLGSPGDLDSVVEESNYLSLHLHLTPETRHLIDKRRIELMKPTACLINVARGGLVDEAALYEALLQGHLGGAGLDVFAEEPPDPNRPVFELPNVVATPHIAGVTDGTSRRRAEFAATNLDRYAQGLEPIGLVP